MKPQFPLTRGAGIALSALALAAALLPLTREPASVRASRPARIAGSGLSSIFLHSRHTTDNASFLLVDLIRPGRPAVSIQRPLVLPGTWTYIHQWAEVAPGTYGMIATAEVPVGASVHTTWPVTGAAALYEDAAPDFDVVVPVVLRRHMGLSSIVTVQNTDRFEPATVAIELRPAEAAAPAVTLTRTLAAGAIETLDLRRCDLAGLEDLPAPFVGSMRVRSATPVTAQSFVDAATGRGVAAFQGVSAPSAPDMLYAPWVNAGPESYGSWLAVANTADEPADVVVTYRPIPGPRCPATPIVHGGGPRRIPPGGMAVFDQRPVAGGATGESGLPSGCTATATIAAPGGRLAAAVILSGAQTLDAYNAVGPDFASTRVAQPIFRTSQAGRATGMIVMNVGDQPAKVRLDVRDSEQRVATTRCPECTQTVEPGRAHVWYAPYMPSIGQSFAGKYGDAALLADQPIVVVYSDASAYRADDAAVGLGLPIRDAPTSGSGSSSPPSSATYAPIVLNNVARPETRASDALPCGWRQAFLPIADRAGE